MEMMSIAVVAKAEHGEEHAAVPPRNSRTVVEHGACWRYGLWTEEPYRIDEGRIVADADAGRPSVILARKDDVDFIVRCGAVVGAIELAGAVPGDALRITEAIGIHVRIAGWER